MGPCTGPCARREAAGKIGYNEEQLNALNSKNEKVSHS